MKPAGMLKPCSVRDPAVKVVTTSFFPRAVQIRLLRSEAWVSKVFIQSEDLRDFHGVQEFVPSLLGKKSGERSFRSTDAVTDRTQLARLSSNSERTGFGFATLVLPSVAEE